MGIFDKLKGAVNNLMNKDFLNAICAACSLVAYADGECTEAEVEKIMKYIKINDDLKSYKATDIEVAFKKHVDSIEFDANIGKLEANKSIEKIVNNLDQCKKLCAVCIAIAKADGSMDKDEISVIHDICRLLNVSPREFNI